MLYKIDLAECSNEVSFELATLISGKTVIEEALKDAWKYGVEKSCTFVNENTHTVNWKFMGIVDAININEHEFLSEIDSNLFVDPSEYRLEKWSRQLEQFNVNIKKDICFGQI
ncbi:MAG TPA: DUF4288 domain-containing protein [Bacteroidia bacterium]